MQPYNPKILTRRTTANMTSKEWFLVKPSGNDDLAAAAAGQLVIGALTNDVGDGSSVAAYLPVQIGGVIKVMCGGACTVGTLAMSDGAGEAVNATADTYAFGIALGTYEDGEIGSFLWAPSHMEST
jgi:hypothetical protein